MRYLEKVDDMAALIAASLFVCVLLIGTPSQAQQADGPHLDYAKRNADTWAEQDKSIDSKLRALENKFGKKPNIIYILTDDIGWGELGWQRRWQASRNTKP